MTIFSKIVCLIALAIFGFSFSNANAAEKITDSIAIQALYSYTDANLTNPEEGYLKQRTTGGYTFYQWSESNRSSKEQAIKWWKDSLEHACFVPFPNVEEAHYDDLFIKVAGEWSFYPTLLDVMDDVDGDELSEIENEILFTISKFNHRIGQSSALIASDELTIEEGSLKPCPRKVK